MEKEVRHEVHCENCGRYLMTVRGTTLVEGLICPNSKCKKRLNIKVMTQDSSDSDMRFKFTESKGIMA